MVNTGEGETICRLLGRTVLITCVERENLSTGKSCCV